MCLMAIAFLALEITRELRYLSSANSDNVHWTLSQAEVEFLELQHAVDRSLHRDNTGLDRVVEEFDIFYSRMDTLARGQLYAPLRRDPAFIEPVTAVRTQLDAMIPIIDGPRDQLRDQLGDFARELHPLRLEVRDLATAGLKHFARSSDASRVSVSVTLLRLGIVTGVLLLALAILLFNYRRVMFQIARRGRELSDAYARLNTILETSLDGVIVAEMDGQILSFNPAAERMFGLEAPDVIGRSMGELILSDPLRETDAAGMERASSNGPLHVIGQGRVKLDAKRANGDLFPLELAIERASTREGTLAVAFLRDISLRVAAENELVQARDRALAGEQAKSEFLAMMTHEIRTPLNGVLGNLSLLKGTQLGTAQARYVRNMEISGELLMQHVDAVLDVARFESGVETMRADVVHLGQLIQDIVDSQSSGAEAHGNSLQWGWVGAPLTWVRIDASRLQQVLLNLVGNAIKFTRNGRITIEAEAYEAGAQMRLDLRVIDTGIGIALDDQARVFEDFQTVKSSQTRAIGGTGLGLSIARRFVQAMEGEIGLESTPGEGSVFWLQIPVEVAQAQDAPAPDATAAVPARATPALNVLLVEDDDINLEIARELLERMAHQVSCARDGQQAVDMAERTRYDLILMDIRMPVMDGLEATRRIRASEGASRDVPIIAFSANVLPEAKERFAAAGMSGFLGKPLKGAELSDLLAEFFAHPSEAASTPTEVPPAAPRNPLEALAIRHSDELQQFFDWLDGASVAAAEIAARAHKLAGSSAAFGQADLHAALIALENAAEGASDTPSLAPEIAHARMAWKNAPTPQLG
ncbi:response regulator [Thioclava sp. BHET1]|nr:response regulator [Thioclava sp. BHET1]